MDQTIASGKYLSLLNRDGWEFVRRTNNSGIVLIIAKTDEGKVLFVEQFRPPVQANVIELPAGLAGDIKGEEDEDFSLAAQRELEEETGYRAGSLREVAAGPISAGLSDEVITMFVASELTRVGPGGGDESEDIIIHEIPVTDIREWLEAKRKSGCLIDPKLYAGLYFLN